MKNLHVNAAYFFGLLMPALETYRRKLDFSNIPIYIDDYLIGLLLLSAAYSVTRKKSYGEAFLAGAWGVLCGGLYYSFIGQLAAENDVSGLSSTTVLAVKGLLLLFSIALLTRTIYVSNKAA